MRTLYTNLDIKITIDSMKLSVLNMIYEQFQRAIPKHSHGKNSYEIHYIPYGRGKAIIDGVEHDIIPNTLYVTGPHVEHEQFPIIDDPMSEYCIYFKLEDRKIRKDSFVSVFKDTTFWYGQDRQNLLPLMQTLFLELSQEHTGYIVEVETLLQQLIVKLIRNYEDTQSARLHFERSNLVDSKYIIVEECFLYEYQDITLQALAKKLQLSTRQTERFLADNYGKTFSQKKAESKMSMASILLKDTQNSITGIAEQLGYSSVEHFSSAFRRYYGLSPRQFRKK